MLLGGGRVERNALVGTGDELLALLLCVIRLFVLDGDAGVMILPIGPFGLFCMARKSATAEAVAVSRDAGPVVGDDEFDTDRLRPNCCC